MQKAVEYATAKKHEFLTPEHILFVLTGLSKEKSIDGKKIKETFERVNVDVESLQNDLRDYLKGNDIGRSNNTIIDSAEINNIVSGAYAHAQALQQDDAGAFLIISIIDVCQEDSQAKYLLKKNGLIDKIKPIASDVPGNENSMLSQFCTNLNKMVGDGKIDMVIGRDDIIDKVTLVLARRRKNNAILVGEPGVGKTAVAEGLAYKIVYKETHEILHDSTVWSLDIGALMAGTRFRGDVEERVKNILKLLAKEHNPIIFIDEIHMIVGSGKSMDSSIDISNLLKPYLANGSIKVVGATTLEEYRKYIEKDKALMRRFKDIVVSEPTVEHCIEILTKTKEYYELHHNVRYTPEAIRHAVILSDRYIRNKHLPDKAYDVIDIVGARARLAPKDNDGPVIVTEEMVKDEISSMANIPSRNIDDDTKKSIKYLGENLTKTVFGQELAMNSLKKAVLVAKAGLREGNKPMGAFLFSGPTGTGKTEAAKSVADTLSMKLIRYDMSEYMEKHSVSKLIGSPPGYVGYGDGGAGDGKLINDIAENPSSVLLIDEIEKAHPDVHNIFLQIMDNGKLTSSSGKDVSFDNVLIIMTSNAGASLVRNHIGFGKGNSDTSSELLETYFSPEFRNRFDQIIQFNRLTIDVMAKIVDKFLDELATITFNSHGISLEFTDSLRELVVKNGFDEKLGARPAKRVIHNEITVPLSERIIEDELKNTHIQVDYDKNSNMVLINHIEEEVVI